MPDDFHRPIARALTPSAVGLLARNLGETPQAVRAALDGAVFAAMRAAAAKSSTEAGAEEVLSVLRDNQAAGAGLLTGNPPGFEARLRAADPADPLVASGSAVDRLFSGRAPGLAAHLASFARIKPESAAALLRLGVSLVLASLNDAGASVERPSGLRRRLRAGAADAQRAAPRGFEPDLGGPAPATPDRGRWLPWLLTALALLLLAFVLLRDRERDEPGALVETVSAAHAGRPARLAVGGADPAERGWNAAGEAVHVR